MDLEALRREHYNATAVGLERPNDELLVLRVRPDQPIPAFDPGQWIAVGLGLWEPRVPGLPEEVVAPEDRVKLARRPFSISCAILAPGGERLLRVEEEDFYEICVAMQRAIPPGGRAAALPARLFALEESARLWVDERPGGRYTLSHIGPVDDAIFLSTATCEAPNNRMIWDLLRRGHTGRIGAVHGTRWRSDQVYSAVHERLMKMYPNYRYVAVTTREPGAPSEHLQELLLSGALEERVGFELDARRCHVFLCGNPGMVGAPRLQDGRLVYPQPPGIVQLLEERGFHCAPQEHRVNIHFERY